MAEGQVDPKGRSFTQAGYGHAGSMAYDNKIKSTDAANNNNRNYSVPDFTEPAS